MFTLEQTLELFLQPEIDQVLASGWLREVHADHTYGPPPPTLWVRNKAIKRLIRGLRRQTSAPFNAHTSSSAIQVQRQRQLDVMHHLQRTQSMALEIKVESQELTWSGKESYGYADVRGSHITPFTSAAKSIRLAVSFDSDAILLGDADDEDTCVVRCDKPSNAFKEEPRVLIRMHTIDELESCLTTWAASFNLTLPTILELPTTALDHKTVCLLYIGDSHTRVIRLLHRRAALQAELAEVERQGQAFGFDFHWI
jgi:hypothetical protein